MKRTIITSVIILFISFGLLTSCFSSKGSLFSKTVESDGSSTKNNDEDDYYYEDEEEEEEVITGLSIETDPDECDIYVDGRYMGVSPLFMENLDSGYYTVTAEHDGYYTKTESVYHSYYNYTEVELSLERKMGYIQLGKEPANAEALFNGILIEEDMARVPVGTYPLVVRLFGYTDFSKYISVKEEQITSIAVKLQPADFDITRFSASKSRINPEAPAAFAESEVTISATNFGSGTVSIINSEGTAVLTTGDISFKTFDTSFIWNGRNREGTILPDGLYTIVLTARENDAAVPIQKETKIVLDSSYVLDLWNVWGGTPGLLFSSLPSILPDGAFSVSLLTMASFGLDEYGELAIRMPLQASVRLALFKNAELALQSTFIFSPNGFPVNASASFKYKAVDTRFFDAAGYAKISYVFDTEADSQANFTGLYAGAALALGTGKLMLCLNPEICSSYTYPSYELEAVNQDIYNYAYLKGGLYLDMFTWSAGLSASFRTRPFAEGFSIDLPFSAGAELNILVPSLLMKLSIVGALQWRSADDYYTSFGVGFGLPN